MTKNYWNTMTRNIYMQLAIRTLFQDYKPGVLTSLTLCALFLCTNGGTSSLKSTPNDSLRIYPWQFYLHLDFRFEKKLQWGSCRSGGVVLVWQSELPWLEYWRKSPRNKFLFMASNKIHLKSPLASSENNTKKAT